MRGEDARYNLKKLDDGDKYKDEKKEGHEIVVNISEGELEVLVFPAPGWCISNVSMMQEWLQNTIDNADLVEIDHGLFEVYCTAFPPPVC